jgi:hypothetical protein
VPIKADHASQPVVEFLKWQRAGILDLRPPFQRNAVWRHLLKSSFIDSLLRGYPIPALFLQDRADPETFERQIVVIDGQQRLRTLLSYIDLTCLQDAEPRDQFTLSPLHDKERGGAAYSDLSPADQNQILYSRLTYYSVDASVSEGELLEIFRRMNTYGAKLNHQELRNARFDGPFKETAYALASEFFEYWHRWKTLASQEIAEMRDAEFTSDLMLLSLEGGHATTQDRLDATYRKYEEEFDEADACISRVTEVLTTLDRIFDDYLTVRRLTKRMWVYSFFDAIQQIRFGGPLLARSSKKKKVGLATFRKAARRVNTQIEAGNIPEELSKATRGAATDRGSRQVRTQYLIDAILS